MDTARDQLQVRLALLRDIASTEQRLRDLYTQLNGSPEPVDIQLDALTQGITRKAIEITAKAYGIDPFLFRTRLRTREVAEARQVVMWLLHDFAGITGPNVSAAFGRCHGVVGHGIRRVRALIDTEPSFAAITQQISEQFREYCMQLHTSK